MKGLSNRSSLLDQLAERINSAQADGQDLDWKAEFITWFEGRPSFTEEDWLTLLIIQSFKGPFSGPGPGER